MTHIITMVIIDIIVLLILGIVLYKTIQSTSKNKIESLEREAEKLVEDAKKDAEAMMKEAIQYLRERTNATKACLDAQLHAIGFYEKLGFTLFTEEFLEEGLLHRGMQMFFER